jgi:hypothetical protein
MNPMTQSQALPTKDVDLSFHGSINLLTPETQRAEDWLAENVGDDETQWWGRSVVVEPRYTDDIVAGMIDAGLAVYIGEGRIQSVG